MKKADIVIGEKYAIKTGLSKYAGSYGPAEVLGFGPVTLRGRRYYTSDRTVTGVKIRYTDEAPGRLANTEATIETKYVDCLWAEKVERNEIARKAAAERKAYAEKNEDLAARLKTALAEVGIKADVTGYRGVKINAFYSGAGDFTADNAVERLIEILYLAATEESG